jgi:hypothetical protein
MSKKDLYAVERRLRCYFLDDIQTSVVVVVVVVADQKRNAPLASGIHPLVMADQERKSVLLVRTGPLQSLKIASAVVVGVVLVDQHHRETRSLLRLLMQ